LTEQSCIRPPGDFYCIPEVEPLLESEDRLIIHGAGEVSSGASGQVYTEQSGIVADTSTEFIYYTGEKGSCMVGLHGTPDDRHFNKTLWLYTPALKQKSLEQV
jgi:hypothetical protein